MISKEQIALNAMTAYIQHVKEQFIAGSEFLEQYVLILKIREWQLRRRKMGRPNSTADLPTLRTGHHNAECLHLDIDGGSPVEAVAEIQNILQLMAREFHAEIADIEGRHPELKAEFARDKEVIRLRWNHFVEESMEAEAVEN